MATDSVACTAELTLQSIRDRLEEARRAVAREIRSYPTPIAGCDVQFNGLMEQRADIARALDRLRAIDGGGLSPDDERRALAALVGSARFLDETTKRALFAGLM